MDQPTELTAEDIDKFFSKLQTVEIKPRECFSCGKKHFNVYGSAFNECDECYFARWPKEERLAFFRSFL